MHVLGSLLFVFGVLLLLFALVNIVYPVNTMGVSTRKQALGLLLMSYLVVRIGSCMGGSSVVPSTGDTAASDSEPGGVTLATWDVDLSPTIRYENTLSYETGTIVLRQEFSDGSSGIQELLERPSMQPTERVFDLERGTDRSEYMTLTDAGIVTYFSWDGRRVMTTNTTSLHDDFLTVGSNPVVRDCVPKQFSAATTEIVQLYERLHAFKEDPDFSFYGFAQDPGRSWLEAVQRLHSRSTPNDAVHQLDQLGFLAGDVMMLGMEYMRAARGSDDSGYIQDMERTIQAGLALATCRTTSVSKEDNPEPK